MQPNVLVVVLDAARRDAFEPYGAPAGSTPAIAQLASRGVAMPDVYATGCWTVPSHSSIFSGLLPRAAGLASVRSLRAAKPAVESLRQRLLPEVFGRAGYRTAAVSANLWVSEGSGFGTGFQDFVQIDTDRHGQIEARNRRERFRWLAEAAVGRVDDGARSAEKTLTRWIEQARSDSRPFFWYVNLMEAHSPYLPPRGYSGVSVVERLRAAEDARRYYTLEGIWKACSGVSTIPESTLDRMRRLYEASVRYMDECLGRVLDRLDANGILDDTLVVALADHGENLGEGGLIAHALSLDNRLLHVPLVAAGPGATSDPIQSLAGLPRFLAEAAGITDHPWDDGPPPGVGLAQFDPPVEPGDSDAARKLESVGLDAGFELFTTPRACAIAHGLKLLRTSQREELFDLRADSLEVTPLRAESLPDRRDDISSLRRALEHSSMAARSEQRQADTEVSAPTGAELRELEERMKLLGYM